MPLKYPIGTRVSLMPAECVTNFMGLDAHCWNKQIEWNSNVHVISDYIYNTDHSVRGYYFESTYNKYEFYWNAEYVIAIDEDPQQWDMEAHHGS